MPPRRHTTGWLLLGASLACAPSCTDNRSSVPVVDSLEPNRLEVGEAASVTIVGSYPLDIFVSYADSSRSTIDSQYAAQVGGMALDDVTYVDATELRATVPAGLDAGVYDLTVTDFAGRSATLADALTVFDGNVVVTDCIDASDCVDPCYGTATCTAGFCDMGPVDKDGDDDGAIDAVCPSGADCDDANPFCQLDCTDDDADTHCVDQDCDDTAETGAACYTACATYFRDADGDGYTNNGDTRDACSDPDGAAGGWVDAATADDCEDDPGTCGTSCAPDLVESTDEANCADGWDNDCDAFVDSADAACASSLEIYYRSTTGADGVASPKTRTWDGSAWTAEVELAAAASPIHSLRVARSPVTPEEVIIVVQREDGWLDAYVCNGGCTETPGIDDIWTSIPTSQSFHFDVAYESVSGEALLVYRKLSSLPTFDLAYRTWDGVWGAEQELDDTSNPDNVLFVTVELASKAGGDAIGLVAGEQTNDHVAIWVWDGDGFGQFADMQAGTNPALGRVALGWEGNSGDLLAVTVSSKDLVYRELTSGWSAPGEYPCATAGTSIVFLSVQPNPAAGTNDIRLTAGTTGAELNSCPWDGAGFVDHVVHSTDLSFDTFRSFDFAWGAPGTGGLLVWGAAAGELRYRSLDVAGVWSNEATLLSGAGLHRWIRLRATGEDGTILGAAFDDATTALGGFVWDGSTLTELAADTFAADVGTSEPESFAIE